MFIMYLLVFQAYLVFQDLSILTYVTNIQYMADPFVCWSVRRCPPFSISLSLYLKVSIPA